MLIKELSKPEGSEISEEHAGVLVLIAAALGCKIVNQTNHRFDIPNTYNLLPPSQTIGLHGGKFYKL